ncbi:Gfo/Idh/MocA family oxidoreductase, partial [Streptomyces tendae]|uniref:Gfo/Idh/MocA family oxidoreductase n=1 Tax=Streptomyces tendae TaxID=1932 RepID=UPI00372471C0
MRIGILGLGRIGAFHAETLAGLDAVDSLVVADPFADAAKAAAERFGAEVADSPEAVLAAGVDGVVGGGAPPPPPPPPPAPGGGGGARFGEDTRAPPHTAGGV